MVKSGQWIYNNSTTPDWHITVMDAQGNKRVVACNDPEEMLKKNLNKRSEYGIVLEYHKTAPADMAGFKFAVEPFYSFHSKVGGGLVNPPADYKPAPADWINTEFISWCASMVSVISFGLKGNTYTARMSNKVVIGRPLQIGVIDPKKHTEIPATIPADIRDDVIVLCSGEYLIATTVESFCSLENTMLLCQGVPEYERAGIITTVIGLNYHTYGPLEVKLTNTSENAVKIYIGEGCVQISFISVET